MKLIAQIGLILILVLTSVVPLVAGCNDPAACNYNSTDTDIVDCCYDNCLQIELDYGVFPLEISWNLYGDSGDALVSGGAPYDNIECLENGCYLFEGLDSFGDGWNGATLSLSLGEDEVFIGTMENTLDTLNIPFALGGYLGCIDSAASNYDSEALCDNGSCLYCLPGSKSFVLYMQDSSGDGWNGAEFIITDLISGVEVISGDILSAQVGADNSGEFHFCLVDGCYGFAVTSGSKSYEISWILSEFNGEQIFSGGAPFDVMGFPAAELGCDIAGCVDETAFNYNPYANISDDGCVFSPDNDICSTAEELNCGETVFSTIEYATSDFVDDDTNCGPPIWSGGVWYRYIGDGNQVNVSSCDEGFLVNTRFTLFSTTAGCDNLVCLDGNDDYPVCQNLGSNLTFTTQIGEDYYLYVQTWGSNDTFSLKTTCYDCDISHQNLSPETAETVEFGETLTNNLCCVNENVSDLCFTGFVPRWGLWYKANSGENCETFNFYLQNISCSNVGFVVFEDNNGELTEFACCGPITAFCSGDLSEFDPLEANTDYYFFVYTTDAVGCGEFEFTVFCGVFGCADPFSPCYDSTANLEDTCCPINCDEFELENDLCAGAIELPCGSADFIHTLECSTAADSPNFVIGCSVAPGPGIWFTFEGTGMLHTIRTCDGSFDELYSLADTEMNIYTSTTDDCSGEFVCAQDAVQGFYLSESDDDQSVFGCGYFQDTNVWMDFVTIPGETYFVYVSGTPEMFRISHECIDLVLGCTSPDAFNYNSLATYDDGTCDYFTLLCADCDEYNTAVQMYMTDAFGDGWTGATYEITDDFGNLVANGNIDDALIGVDEDDFVGNEIGIDFFCLCGESCYSISVGGGTFDSEISWELSTDDGTIIAFGGGGQSVEYCQIVGCLDPEACNYESDANIDSQMCLPPPGCLDPEAGNYDPDAACGGGYCSVFGDMNNDEVVNVSDLLEFLGQFGCQGDCVSDLNGDGIVNIFDLLILLGIL